MDPKSSPNGRGVLVMEPTYWRVTTFNEKTEEQKSIGLYQTYEVALQTVKALALSKECEALALNGNNRHGGRFYYWGVLPTALFYLIEPVY